MSGYVYLAIAICAEVVATTSMKALAGFNRPLPLLLVVTGYSLSFWMLALVVRTIPVGIAYAIWAGLGIVLSASPRRCSIVSTWTCRWYWAWG